MNKRRVQRAMKWEKLLSKERLNNKTSGNNDGRSEFVKDYDRIVFSSSFRRLQDKTQVFPLSGSDYVRTRLTHSIETSCLGRSLGAMVGEKLEENGSLPEGIAPSDIGAIVAAACLAHDIGNPPFGHSGEAAIQHWFKTSPVAKKIRKKIDIKQVADIEKYEGNAAGFRLITRLIYPDSPGLCLTKGVLAAFSKYPAESERRGFQKNDGASEKKFGFFQAEKIFFKDVAQATGLIKKTKKRLCWHRHPLAFLVEAADDICYHIIDFEDAARLGMIPFEELKLHFLGIISGENLREISDEQDRIQYLRALAISKLLQEAAHVFMEKESQILNGKFDQPLTEIIPSAGWLKKMKTLMREKVYTTRSVVEVEAAGFDVVTGLLDVFIESAEDIAASRRMGKEPCPRSATMIRLVPKQFLWENGKINKNAYIRTMRIIDFICGMTDSFAVSLYKKVKGISLP